MRFSEFLLITLSSAFAVQAAEIGQKTEDNKCNGVTINNEYYDVEELKADIDRPFLLATDYSRNIVYFSYSLDKGDDVFKSACVNLDTKEFTDIEVVNNGFAQAVDQKSNDVYIGGNDGIYKYDAESKKAELIGGKDSNIWSLYYKDNIYYSDFPGQFLYTIVDGKSVRVKDLEDTKVDHFIIDDDDTFFFTNDTGLFSQKRGTKDAVLYEEFPYNGARGITMDKNGKVYVCLKEGIYSVDKTSVTLNKLVDLDDGFGIAFDRDNNIIYSDTTHLFRLKPNKDKACV